MSKDSLQSPKARKLGYSSQLAFVISLIAGSVGTGNIWRFPRVAAANGGAFVLAYIIMMFIVIIPVMMGEHFMGRRSRRGAPGTFKLIAGKKATWLGTIVAFIMAMTAAYYSAVLAWIVYYVGLSFTKGYYGADKAALFALRHICLVEDKKIFAFKISVGSLAKLSAVAENYALTHLDKPLKSYAFLKSVLP